MYNFIIMKYLLLPLFYFECICSFSQATFPDGDRPSNSISPHTINKNGLQTELGYTRMIEWITKKEKDIKYLLPQLQMRYGASNRLELRTGVNFFNVKNIASNGIFTNTILPLLNIGVKYKLLKQRKFIPTFSILAETVNKTKYKLIGGLDSIFDYSIKLLFENKINDNFLLRYALGFEKNYLFSIGKKYTYSITPTYTFNDEWRLYIEYHGLINTNNKGKAAHYIATGLQYAFTDKMKIDVSSGYNFGKKKPFKEYDDMYYSLGFMYKFN